MNITSILHQLDQTLAQHPIEGVSYLGGEPFEQSEALLLLAQEVRKRNLTNMIYSGYEYEDLISKNSSAEILKYTDLLVDGPYLESRRETKRRFIGSDNQKLHFLSPAYQPSDPRFQEPNRLEIRLKDNEVLIHGFPHTT